jgi:hypothetical protein
MEFELMSQEELQRSVQQLLDRQPKHEPAAPATAESLAEKADQLTDGLIGLTALVKRVVDDIDRIVEHKAEAATRHDREAETRVNQLNQFVSRAQAQLVEVLDLFERTLAIQNVTRRAGE